MKTEKNALIFQLGDKKIQYYAIGNNKEKVLLKFHGGHSNCYDTLGDEVFYESGYTVLTPSRPGYTETSVFPEKTLENFSKAVKRLLDELSIKKVVVLGISAGGPTAIKFASLYPETVDKLILECAVTKEWLKKSDKAYRVARIAFSPMIQGFTWALLKFTAKHFRNRFIRSMCSGLSKASSQSILSGMTKDQSDRFISAFLMYSSYKGFLFDLSNYADAKDLENIKAPTLIIHSKNDNSVPFEFAVYANQKIIGSKLLELENNLLGHFIWLDEEYGETKDKIKQFLIQEGRYVKSL